MLAHPADELTAFLGWFVNQPIGMFDLAPKGPGTIFSHSSVTTCTLFRAPPWQVEFVTMHPGVPGWPGEHRHPHVDSYEMGVSCALPFIKNGQKMTKPDLVIQVPVNINSLVHVVECKCVRLLPTDWHGAERQPHGASLFSVQRWADGVPPTSVGLDWDGLPTTDGHAAQLLSDRLTKEEDSSRGVEAPGHSPAVA